MLITIGGLPGSGSSTIGTLLSEKLERKRIDAGDLWDKMARDHNTDVLGLNVLAEKDTSIDTELDERMIETAKNNNTIILESRLIGYFCKQKNIPAFKIWLTADQEIRVNRLKKDGRLSERVIEREESEKKRYKERYNIDIDDVSVYDLVVDASDKLPGEIVSDIIHTLKDNGIID
ncbi:cytidylate kinase family protein [Patescibacteria group bacterium]|nr:cytidylate kinase family protein [Patescibacteria group bacterium]